MFVCGAQRIVLISTVLREPAYGGSLTKRTFQKGVKQVEEKSSETTRRASMLCSIGIIAKHYGVSPSTIRRWAQRGLIKVACPIRGTDCFDGEPGSQAYRLRTCLIA